MDGWEGFDFGQLAARLARHIADLVHRPDGEQLHGDALYAEALRRTLATPSSGVVSVGESLHLIEAHTIVDRTNRETTERRVTELEVNRFKVRSRMCLEIGDDLERLSGNQNAISSRYRREGVATAAQVVRNIGRGEQRIADQMEAHAAAGKDS